MLAILDTPEKASLLIEIESIIAEQDLSIYRASVMKHQDKLLQQTSQANERADSGKMVDPLYTGNCYDNIHTLICV